jgi:fatty-acyl-CoA synthase
MCPAAVRIHVLWQQQSSSWWWVPFPHNTNETLPAPACPSLQGSLSHLDREGRVQLKLKQGRPHVLLDMRIVGEQGQELPWDGKSFGDLQVRQGGAVVVAIYCGW